MIVISVVLLCHLIGTLDARQPNIDINRVKLVPRELSHLSRPTNFQGRRYLRKESNQIHKRNDPDYSSDGSSKAGSPLLFLHDASTLADAKTPIKIYQPREDPRFFYQSDAYLQEVDRKNLKYYDVSSIYPGRKIVRPGEYNGNRRFPTLLEDQEGNPCVRCPNDRTIIAKGGSDHVILQKPRLFECSGRKAPRHIRLAHMYGPTFGSLLKQGTHIVVGQMMFKNRALQLCKMQIDVLTQGCPVPKHLVAECENGDKQCNFTCKDMQLELHGNRMATCGDNMRWMEELPICKVRTWCKAPTLPDHGRLSCKGLHTSKGFTEGSRCHIRCSPGYRWTTRAVSICRRGQWSHNLKCQTRNSYNKTNY